MRVLVCGGRRFVNRRFVNATLDAFHEATPVTVLIHGNARGADRAAGFWARQRGIPLEEYEADWLTYSKAAGPIRNQRMLAEGKPDVVIAFPGGSGTADMCTRAEHRGVSVLRFAPEGS